MSEKILLVDDDLNVLRMVAEALEYKGYRITEASSGEAAIEALDNQDFDLVITDLNMYEVDGFGVLKSAKKRNPHTMVMLLTGSGLATSFLYGLSPGFDEYLPKPCHLDELLKRVANCLEKLKAEPRDTPLGHTRRATLRRGVRLSAP